MRGQFPWPFAGLRLGALPATHYQVAEMDRCPLEIEGETGCGEGSNGEGRRPATHSFSARSDF